MEREHRCVLKQFACGGAEEEGAFLRRMQQLKGLEAEAAGLILTPAAFFKFDGDASVVVGDEASGAEMTAEGHSALVEVPWYDSQGTLAERLADRSLTRSSGGGGEVDGDEGDDDEIDPGSRVTLSGRVGVTTAGAPQGYGSALKVEVKWDDDGTTDHVAPAELKVIETAVSRFSKLNVVEVFQAILKGVMLLHANGIRGVVSTDSIVMVDDEAAGTIRPLLTCGLSRRGLSASTASSSSAASLGDRADEIVVAAAATAAPSACAPELQEPCGEWSSATDIWVVGSLLHRAIYSGKEPLLLPGQDCAKLPEVYRDSLEQRVCDLLRRLLQRDPAQRASATEAASHPYFSGA